MKADVEKSKERKDLVFDLKEFSQGVEFFQRNFTVKEIEEAEIQAAMKAINL